MHDVRSRVCEQGIEDASKGRVMANRALCVGINDYPDTNMDLGGCVNDATDWQALLERRGYRVDRLHDAEATRQRIVDALKDLIAHAGPGDSVVFTFAGHGSWLPDRNGDERDGRDEMMCPFDVMKDQYLLDDDLYDIFRTKEAGVRLYVIADSCHSGSVVRYAPLPKEGDAPLKARFLPPYLFARGNSGLERAIDRVVNAPAPTKLKYPAVLLAACQDRELSYDASFNRRPNGAFTRTAIDALQDARITSPRALHDAIRTMLPSHAFAQTPQLFGSSEAKLGPLF